MRRAHWARAERVTPARSTAARQYREVTRCLRLAVAEKCCELTHSPFRPVGIESTQDLILVLEALCAIANQFRSLAGHDTLGVPIKKIIEAADAVEDEFPSFVVGEVIRAVFGDIDVQIVVCPEPDRHGSNAKFLRQSIYMGLKFGRFMLQTVHRIPL